VKIRNLEDAVEHMVAAVELESVRNRTELMAGLAATDRGNRIDGARYRSLPQYSNQVAWSASARLVGWSLRAVGGAAVITFYDGHDGSDAASVIGTVGLSGDGISDTKWFGPGGISATEALYVAVTGPATSVVGGVYIGAVD
jgi:hypothetical protein